LGSKRALIETVVGRYKGLIGSRLRARSFTAQQTEVAIGCIVLNAAGVRTPGVCPASVNDRLR
jgi:hypothetical protein